MCSFFLVFFLLISCSSAPLAPEPEASDEAYEKLLRNHTLVHDDRIALPLSRDREVHRRYIEDHSILYELSSGVDLKYQEMRIKKGTGHRMIPDLKEIEGMKQPIFLISPEGGLTSHTRTHVSVMGFHGDRVFTIYINPSDSSMTCAELFQHAKKCAISAYQQLRSPSDEVSPLITAARKGDLKQVQKLIQSGADLEVYTRKGETPLIVAAGAGHTEIVQTLLDAGANLHARTLRTETALIKAVKGNDPETVKTLLQAGADPYVIEYNTRDVNMGDQCNRNVLQLATDKGYREVVHVLKCFR